MLASGGFGQSLDPALRLDQVVESDESQDLDTNRWIHVAQEGRH